MAHQFKPGVIHQVQDIVFRAGIKIIQTNDVIAACEQALA